MARSFDLVIGVDGSSSSSDVVTQVAGALHAPPGRVALVRVIDATATVDDKMRALAELRDLNAQHPSLEAASVLLYGEAAAAIHDYAVEHAYDAIVVGERGAGDGHHPLGSVAASLAAGNDIPVVLVDARNRTWARGGAHCRSVSAHDRGAYEGVYQRRP